MSEKESRKAGIELDAIDLSSLSIPPSIGKPTEPESPPSDLDEPKENTGVGVETWEAPEERSQRTETFGRRIWVFVGIILSIVIGSLLMYRFMGLRQTRLGDAEGLPADVRKTVQVLADNTVQLRSAIADVEAKCKVINSKKKIALILKTVGSITTQLPDYEFYRKQYVLAVDRHHDKLTEAGQDVLIETANFFKQESDIQYLQVLEEYMTTLEKYLTYFYRNFDEVKQQQQPQIDSYERIYLEYKRILDKYEQVSTEEKRAVGQLLQIHPQAEVLFLYQEKGAIFSFN